MGINPIIRGWNGRPLLIGGKPVHRDMSGEVIAIGGQPIHRDGSSRPVSVGDQPVHYPPGTVTSSQVGGLPVLNGGTGQPSAVVGPPIGQAPPPRSIPTSVHWPEGVASVGGDGSYHRIKPGELTDSVDAYGEERNSLLPPVGHTYSSQAAGTAHREQPAHEQQQLLLVIALFYLAASILTTGALLGDLFGEGPGGIFARVDGRGLALLGLGVLGSFAIAFSSFRVFEGAKVAAWMKVLISGFGLLFGLTALMGGFEYPSKLVRGLFLLGGSAYLVALWFEVVLNKDYLRGLVSLNDGWSREDDH